MDTRADFGTAQAVVSVTVSIVAATVSEPRLYVVRSYTVPALVSVPAISGHSISAVAPDHSYSKEVSVQAIAA